MSLFELRHFIESRLPWYFPFVFPFILVGLVYLLVYFERFLNDLKWRKIEKIKEKSGLK